MGVVKMSTRLKKTLSERGIKQKFIAGKTGIPESYISMAVQGKFNLTPVQKQKIAEVLNVPVHAI